MQPLLFKEWLKLRPFWLLALIGNGLLMLYLWIDIRHGFSVEHAEMIYYQANQIGRLFYEDLRYAPLLTGVALAVAQFVPEVNKGRMRLSMHLPINLAALTLTYLIIGLGSVLVVLFLNGAGLYAIIATYFPREFADSAISTAMPWLMAGVVAYLGATMTLLEPRRGRQVFSLIVSLGLVWLFHLTGSFSQYNEVIWGLGLLTVLMIPAVLLPVYRFRYGGL